MTFVLHLPLDHSLLVPALTFGYTVVDVRDYDSTVLQSVFEQVFTDDHVNVDIVGDGEEITMGAGCISNVPMKLEGVDGIVDTDVPGHFSGDGVTRSTLIQPCFHWYNIISVGEVVDANVNLFACNVSATIMKRPKEKGTFTNHDEPLRVLCFYSTQSGAQPLCEKEPMSRTMHQAKEKASPRQQAEATKISLLVRSRN